MSSGCWLPDRAYNQLPPLPPTGDLETRAVLRRCIEARGSSEIENVVTTADAIPALSQVRPPIRNTIMRMTEPASLLVGSSSQIQQVRRMIEMVAPTDLPVVISGETGSGKEFVARELHRLGRSRGHLVCVNCANLVPSLADSQLFGTSGEHSLTRRTSASVMWATRIVGRYSSTRSLSSRCLFRGSSASLGDQGVRPLGGAGCQHSSFSFIAATSEQLLKLVQESRSGSDLYYRLGSVQHPPAAAQHDTEDILELAEFFLRGHESTRRQLLCGSCRSPAELLVAWKRQAAPRV